MAIYPDIFAKLPFLSIRPAHNSAITWRCPFRYTFLLAVGTLSGCISIDLLPPPPALVHSHSRISSYLYHGNGVPEIKPLPVSNKLYYKKPYHPVVEIRFTPTKNDRVIAGTIFAGVIMPVGSVTVVTPSLHLESALREKLLQESTQIISTKRIEVFEITIDTLSLTVWDLLITRKISCTLRASTTPLDTDNQLPKRSFEAHSSAYTTYAFQRELSFYLRGCFDLLAGHIVDGFSSPIQRSNQ